MATCAICRRKPVVDAFCSKRCADVDLQRWFSGGYVIPESVDEARSEDRDED
jgi:endogenous inhibitor of DNA gyrase (YacG/DUF329 family)